jgi:hypothetical protein
MLRLSENSLRQFDVLEVFDDLCHLSSALGPNVSDLPLFNVPPLSILAILVLLEQKVELSEKVCIDVSEESQNIFSRECVQSLLKGLHELPDLKLIALETLYQYVR